MAPPRSRALGARQVRELLAGSSHTPDPEVAEPAMAEAYTLDGGQSLLVFEDGRGRLYESRRELLAMMTAVAEGPAISSPELPYGKEFVARVPRLVAALAEASGRPGALDRSEVSLDEIDALVGRLGAAECQHPERFASLVAYVGEVIRVASGGQWRMEPAGGGWEPWVVDGRGRRYSPYGLVLAELAEWGRDSSVRGAVAGALGAHRLDGK